MIIALRLSAACWTETIALLQILDRRPALLVDQPVGVVGQRADVLRGDAGIARRRCARRRSRRRGRARARRSTLVVSIDILEDVGDRILVLVAEQLGQPLGQALDAVDQLRRAVEQGAEAARGRRDDRAALRAHLRDRRRPRTAPSSWISLTPVKPTPLICARRALEHRRLLIDLDPDPHEFGPVGEQRNLLHLADRHAGEGDVGALVEPADRLREIDVVAFGLLVREAGEPDDEQQHAGEQRHRHRADHHIVRPRLHLGYDPRAPLHSSPRQRAPAAR